MKVVIWQCTQCKKEFATPQGLAGHKRWVHEGKRPLGGQAILEGFRKGEAIIAKGLTSEEWQATYGQGVCPLCFNKINSEHVRREVGRLKAQGLFIRD